MSPFVSIGHLMRRLSSGVTEDLRFEPGVNLLVGRPNTGKTKWLQTLDYLLGDTGENPFEVLQEEGLAGKYDSAGAELLIGEERIWVERRWLEAGAKTKIFVDDEGMTARDSQEFLMKKLRIPLVNFPKGNPMSGQTWPELSFRMLLRHIYRQQRFWSGIADQQPEGEQHACLLLFLGLAEHLFTEDYGKLVDLRMKSERLRARRDQYDQTLDALVGDLISEPGLAVGANTQTVQVAEERLGREIQKLNEERIALLSGARDNAIPIDQQSSVTRLTETHAGTVTALEGLRRKAALTAERLSDIRRYRNNLGDELERMSRAEDAGSILGNLKITHCPACDQTVVDQSSAPGYCFLCHQQISEEPIFEGLGPVRLRFERDRLTGEFKEADELTNVLQREVQRLTEEVWDTEERLQMLENELAPARQAVAALVQQQVSGVDSTLGQLHERQRQLGRVSAALEVGKNLGDQIADLEQEIGPLQEKVNEAARATDFEAAAAKLEDGMNAYLSAINLLQPGVWRHSPIRFDISRSGFTFRVGNRRASAVLGGTDTLYYLMAYHYGLLTLSDKAQCHYPGLTIIDLLGEFSGEKVADKENFIVQPFIDLLAKDTYRGAQLIISGASFEGLEKVHRIPLTYVFSA